MKLIEIRAPQRINLQFKNKLQYRLLHSGTRFQFDLEKLTHFKKIFSQIFIKGLESGNYDIQFVWKYYFPTKYLDITDNEFYY
jgi:hypothetical protein